MAELRRGWPVLLGCAAGLGAGITMFAQTSSFFVKPLAAEFGWTRGEISLLAAVGVLTSLALPAVGLMVDRFGPRLIVLIGTCLFAVGYVALAVMPGSLWIFYFIVAFIGLTAGPATAPLVFMRPVVAAFKAARGLALAVGMSGSAVILIVFLPLLHRIIAQWSWRGGYLALAVLTFTCGFAAYLLFGVPGQTRAAPGAAEAIAPAGSARGAALGNAARDPRFWLLALSMAAGNFAGGGFSSQVQPLLSDLKIDGGTAALLGSLYFTSALIGRVLVGALLDRLWAPAVGCAALSGPALGLLVFLYPQPIWMFSVGVFAMGIALGAEGDILAFFTARYFGLKSFGVVFGVLLMCLGLALSAGAVAAGFAFDHLKSYHLALQVGSACALVSAVSLLATGLVRRGGDGPDLAPIDANATNTVPPRGRAS